MKKWYLFILIVCCFACAENETEKYQSKCDNVVYVGEELTEIVINDVLLNMYVKPYIFGDYLVVLDPMSNDKLIHIFDNDSFGYITSTGQLGRGPGEITNVGEVQYDKTNNELLVTDASRYCVFAYSVDSLMSDPLHFPYIKATLDEKLHMSHYAYINDTLSIGRLIEPTSNYTFREYIAKWNMANGKIEKMPYEHPDIENKRVVSAVSVEHGLYVECYNYHDLMTICTLDGELKYNIYGSKWDATNSRDMLYYGFDAVFRGDKILVPYFGKSNDDDAYPTSFLVFNINGDYIKTLETGRSIEYFCYDEENDRVIISFNNKIQLAYLNLSGLL